MQIQHIFNVLDIKPENNKLIDFQEFNGSFWKNSIKEEYIPPKEIEDLHSDFARQYYYALRPIKDGDIISQYDKFKIDSITKKLGSDLLLISGDFWGIQKFISEDLTTAKAPKILRSRSAMVLLITYAVVQAVKKRFKGSELLLFGAGKFMMVAKRENLDEIDEIQKELDSYFRENFFGQNGFILSTSLTTSENLLNQANNMKDDLESLGKDNELKKFTKFDLLNAKDEDILIDPFGKAKQDDEICSFCKKRIESVRVDDTTLACEVCANQIRLGTELTKKSYVGIFSTKEQKSKEYIKLIKIFDEIYYAKFSNNIDTLDGDIFDISEDEYFDYPKWALKSYIPINEIDEIKTFSEYIEKDTKVVSSGLMALKADIDLLGNTFRELYKEDFKKFNRLSREVDYFFSEYITKLISKNYNNVYTVFAGGDDLFLIGEYREIVKLAKEIRDEFYKFSLKKTTISMGLVMFKPSMPINFVSKMADIAEKRAKKERDSIDIFGVSMKFDEFLKIEKNFEEVCDFFESNNIETTSFYYILIKLCEMRENLCKAISKEDNYKDYKFNPNDAMWQSKLNYSFKRNIYNKLSKEDNRKESLEKLKCLKKLIEKGEKFKPSIFLKIYNNRDKKKEK